MEYIPDAIIHEIHIIKHSAFEEWRDNETGQDIIRISEQDDGDDDGEE